MSGRILVTGATGTVGSEVVKQLVETGADIRVAARRPDIADGRVEAVVMDFRDTETIDAAVEGVDSVFLISPAELDSVELVTQFVKAAHKAGVTHVVKLSGLGMSTKPWHTLSLMHQAEDAAVEESGIAHTFVHANFFMQNFLRLPTITRQDRIYDSLGAAETSYIDVRDIAAAVVRVLIGGEYVGKTFQLTGSRALTQHKVAEILSQTVGRTIEYAVVSEDVVRQNLRAIGLSDAYVEIMIELFAAQREGHSALVTADLHALLGRPAISFEQFAADHVDRFRRAH